MKVEGEESEELERGYVVFAGEGGNREDLVWRQEVDIWDEGVDGGVVTTEGKGKERRGFV